MKKVKFAFVFMLLLSFLAGCGDLVSKKEMQQVYPNIKSTGEPDEIERQIESEENIGSTTLLKETEQMQEEQTKQERLELEEMSILMKVNGEAVAVVWEDNESVAALTELLREQPMSIQMSMYGGFEQVGFFETSLPRDDKQTTTQAGDIVLYSGSQIVVFYGSNSWAYTRLGRITNKSTAELEELLSNGDVTITLELGM